MNNSKIFLASIAGLALALMANAACSIDADPVFGGDTAGEGGKSSSSGTTGSSTGTSGNGGAGPTCGDGNVDPGEECDGDDLTGKTCETIPGGYAGGTLKCAEDCKFDKTDCEAPASCGDGSCNNGETNASCPGDCPADCGNDVTEGTEICDGTDVNGLDCDIVNPGHGWTGTLKCQPDCSDYDTSECKPVCGNNTKEGTETCDGSDLDGKTCTTVPGGFVTGTLSCNSSCAFDTTSCRLPCTAGSTGGDDDIDRIDVFDPVGVGFVFNTVTSGSTYYSTSTNKTFAGEILPGYAALALNGLNGSFGTIKLYKGSTPTSRKWWTYATNALPNPACAGVNGLQQQACLAKIATSFNCQFHGEVVGCPSPAIVFTEQPATDTITLNGAGWQPAYIDIKCP